MQNAKDEQWGECREDGHSSLRKFDDLNQLMATSETCN
jgi:hypothetical protein